MLQHASATVPADSPDVYSTASTSTVMQAAGGLYEAMATQKHASQVSTDEPDARAEMYSPVRCETERFVSDVGFATQVSNDRRPSICDLAAASLSTTGYRERAEGAEGDECDECSNEGEDMEAHEDVDGKGVERTNVQPLMSSHFPPVPAAKPPRLRCGACAGCHSKVDCGSCVNCLDKPRFGGPGVVRKGCVVKACSGNVAYSSADADGLEEEDDDNDDESVGGTRHYSDATGAWEVDRASEAAGYAMAGMSAAAPDQGRESRVRRASWKMEEAKRAATAGYEPIEPPPASKNRSGKRAKREYPGGGAPCAPFGQCERHPLCTRGFRHGGRGGDCSSLPTSLRCEEAAEETSMGGNMFSLPKPAVEMTRHLSEASFEEEARERPTKKLSAMTEEERRAYNIRENARRRRNEEGRLKRLGWSYVPRNPGVDDNKYTYYHPEFGERRSLKQVFQMHAGDDIRATSRGELAGPGDGAEDDERWIGWRKGSFHDVTRAQPEMEGDSVRSEPISPSAASEDDVALASLLLGAAGALPRIEGFAPQRPAEAVIEEAVRVESDDESANAAARAIASVTHGSAMPTEAEETEPETGPRPINDDAARTAAAAALSAEAVSAASEADGAACLAAAACAAAAALEQVASSSSTTEQVAAGAMESELAPSATPAHAPFATSPPTKTPPSAGLPPAPPSAQTLVRVPQPVVTPHAPWRPREDSALVTSVKRLLARPQPLDIALLGLLKHLPGRSLESIRDRWMILNRTMGLACPHPDAFQVAIAAASAYATPPEPLASEGAPSPCPIMRPLDVDAPPSQPSEERLEQLPRLEQGVAAVVAAAAAVAGRHDGDAMVERIDSINSMTEMVWVEPRAEERRVAEGKARPCPECKKPILASNLRRHLRDACAVVKANALRADGPHELAVAEEQPAADEWDQLRSGNIRDCGECINCLDKPRFGGTGTRKQSCVRKLPMNRRSALPLLADRTAALSSSEEPWYNVSPAATFQGEATHPRETSYSQEAYYDADAYPIDAGRRGDEQPLPEGARRMSEEPGHPPMLSDGRASADMLGGEGGEAAVGKMKLMAVTTPQAVAPGTMVVLQEAGTLADGSSGEEGEAPVVTATVPTGVEPGRTFLVYTPTPSARAFICPEVDSAVDDDAHPAPVFYRCRYPGCTKMYRHTDTTRKHARKDHPEWLAQRPGPGGPASYCALVQLGKVRARTSVASCPLALAAEAAEPPPLAVGTSTAKRVIGDSRPPSTGSYGLPLYRPPPISVALPLSASGGLAAAPSPMDSARTQISLSKLSLPMAVAAAITSPDDEALSPPTPLAPLTTLALAAKRARSPERPARRNNDTDAAGSGHPPPAKRQGGVRRTGPPDPRCAACLGRHRAHTCGAGGGRAASMVATAPAPAAWAPPPPPAASAVAQPASQSASTALDFLDAIRLMSAQA